MLKTNSKKAKEKVRRYIIDHFTWEEYMDTPLETFPDIAAFIMSCFRSEKYHMKEDFQYYHNDERAAFFDWCAGLPTVLDTCYFYNRSPVDDLGEILEETQEEKERYTVTQAEKLLTELIYRELIAEERKEC